MKKLLKVLLVLVLVSIIAYTAIMWPQISYVTNYTLNGFSYGYEKVKDGSWRDEGKEEFAAADFTPGEYAGIKFETVEDVANYYVQAYNNTKSQTREYVDSKGEKHTWYSFLGTENLSLNSILVDGSENSLINNLAPGIVNSLFASSPTGLPPSDSRQPQSDPWVESIFTADDIQNASVTDNGDGTITLVIQPKNGSNSLRGQDSTGRFLNVLGDVASTVESISVLSWASGTTEENCVLRYENGSGTIKIDTATNTIIEADYIMPVMVDIRHASVMVIKDKSALVDITYEMHFPCDEQYVKDTLKVSYAN